MWRGRRTDLGLRDALAWALVADLSFERDIRPLFRDTDVESMSGHFDLSSYEDVRENADAIHARLEDGSMPCDGPWPPENVERFSQWINAGLPR
jgi:hypothetical protein